MTVAAKTFISLQGAIARLSAKTTTHTIDVHHSELMRAVWLGEFAGAMFENDQGRKAPIDRSELRRAVAAFSDLADDFRFRRAFKHKPPRGTRSRIPESVSFELLASYNARSYGPMFWKAYGDQIYLDLAVFDRWADEWRNLRAPTLPPTIPDRPAQARSLRKKPKPKPSKEATKPTLRFSEAKAKDWYQDNRANLDVRPTEIEDHAALNERFNDSVPRPVTRSIRKHFFPDMKRGPRGPRARRKQ